MRGVTLAALAALLATAAVAQGGRGASPPPCPVICGDDTPAWSPDGRTIAFIRYVQGGSGPRATVASVPASGGAVRSVLGLDSLYPKGDGPLGPFRSISWSPDAAMLAFAGSRGGGWTIPAAGGRASSTGGTDLPVWSPDGRRIAIETPRDVGPYRSPVYIPAEIRIAAADGSSPRVLAGTDPSVPGGYWAANGAWSSNDEIAYLTGARVAGGWIDLASEEIWSIRPDGSGAHRLVPARLQGSFLGYRLLGWSSDGARLFFVVRGLAEVFSIDRGGGTPAYVYAADPPSEAYCCRISPNGARLAAFRTTAGKRFDLWVVELTTGTGTRVLAGATKRSASSWMSWSPDSRRLALASGDECGPLFGIETVAADGSQRKRLTSPCRTDGGPGRDVLRAGSGPDALYGHGGADTIDGEAGPDYVQAGAGDDVVHGGTGDDRIFGGPGRDVLWGDGGRDTISARDDTFWARKGQHDVVHCGTGDDTAYVDYRDVVALDCEAVFRR